jgi:hypothetical protein
MLECEFFIIQIGKQEFILKGCCVSICLAYKFVAFCIFVFIYVILGLQLVFGMSMLCQCRCIVNGQRYGKTIKNTGIPFVGQNWQNQLHCFSPLSIRMGEIN